MGELPEDEGPYILYSNWILNSCKYFVQSLKKIEISIFLKVDIPLF